MRRLRTQVCIVGAGPAGLMLSQLLDLAGIDSIVLDRQSREHIEQRVRAGVLEWGSVEALEEAGVGTRLHRDGLPHSGCSIAFDGDLHRIDFEGLTGKRVMVFGQTEVTRDLMAARATRGGDLRFEVGDVELRDLDGALAEVRFAHAGEKHAVACDFVAGCDGFHGVSRRSIPASVLRTFERVYPFGWLGVLVEQPPLDDELVYANHARGFALCSMRSRTRSRYYVQCDLHDHVDSWSDDRFFDELSERVGDRLAARLTRGESFEKSIAPLRSFVAEPMRHGRLLLAGDAAHIVPPTGAKGLNLAIADVRLLARALTEHFRAGNDAYLNSYSETCLRRVWKVERFSWFMSMMLHQFPDSSDFDRRMQRAEFDHLADSETASRSLAENYVGLPLE